jgi:prepilin-type N-terminal cleavage/methylation domain-containing protein
LTYFFRKSSLPQRHRHGMAVARAFTMVEVVVSVVIVGLLLAASLRAVGLSAIMQYRITEHTRSSAMARALMAEIVQQAYSDPGASPVFGPESGESRDTFDDVDDYDGLVDSPPLTREGTKLPLPKGGVWRRIVEVKWVDPLTLAVASPQAETGVKMITVTVKHNHVTLATVTAIRTNAP